jgi:hypothetical protein
MYSSHNAVVARMDRAMQPMDKEAFLTAFDAASQEIVKELEVLLRAKGVPLGAPDEILADFRQTLDNYKASFDTLITYINKAPEMESEMSYQSSSMWQLFPPLMKLMVRDTNIQEGDVKPDIVVSAVLPHLQDRVKRRTEEVLPRIGQQNIVGTYVVGEYAAPSRGSNKETDDAEKLQKEVCWKGRGRRRRRESESEKWAQTE